MNQKKEIKVTYFSSPTEPEVHSLWVSSKKLKPERLNAQTRVYHFSAEDETWLFGRVIDIEDSKYLIRFPDKKEKLLTPQEFDVRWDQPLIDPVPLLASMISETPFFHQRRREVRKELTEQRSLTQGIPAFIASAIELVDYQYKTIKRILQDPIQRYLLGDEVGLGKTIVAGILLYQHMLDFPEHRILILVPSSLKEQWMEELKAHFYMEKAIEDEMVKILSHEEKEEVKYVSQSQKFTYIVVDEAHHLSRFAWSYEKEDQIFFKSISKLCHESPRLLLLTATPVLHNEDGFF